MKVLKLKPNVRHGKNQIRVALEENVIIVEPTPNGVNNLDIPAGPITLLQLEQPTVIEIDTTEPTVINQEVSIDIVNGQHNYRRSERLMRAPGKAASSSERVRE